MDYKQKYLKYKNKYLDLKGGMRRGFMPKSSRTTRRSSNNSNSSSSPQAANPKVLGVLSGLRTYLGDFLTQMKEKSYKMLGDTYPTEQIKSILDDFRFDDSKITGDLFLYKIYLDLIGLDTAFNEKKKYNENLEDEQKYMKNLKDNFPIFKSLDDKLHNELKEYIKPSEPSINIDYDNIKKQALYNLIMVIVDSNYKNSYKFDMFEHEYFKDFDSYFKFIKNIMEIIIELDNNKNSNDENNKLLIEFTDYLNNNDGTMVASPEVYKKILNTEEYNQLKKTLFIYIIRTRNINYFKYFYEEFVLQIFNKNILNEKEKKNCIENIIYDLRIINYRENKTGSDDFMPYENNTFLKMFEYMYMETQYQEEIIKTIIKITFN